MDTSTSSIPLNAWLVLFTGFSVIVGFLLIVLIIKIWAGMSALVDINKKLDKLIDQKNSPEDPPQLPLQ